MNKHRFLSAGDAARVLGVTPGAIRFMVQRGELPVAAMTEGGIHLFRRAAVAGLARRRAKRGRGPQPRDRDAER